MVIVVVYKSESNSGWKVYRESELQDALSEAERLFKQEHCREVAVYGPTACKAKWGPTDPGTNQE